MIRNTSFVTTDTVLRKVSIVLYLSESLYWGEKGGTLSEKLRYICFGETKISSRVSQTY